MVKNEAHLLKRIEIAKKHLIEAAKERDFTDPRVLKISQSLDHLLNKYDQLKKASD